MLKKNINKSYHLHQPNIRIGHLYFNPLRSNIGTYHWRRSPNNLSMTYNVIDTFFRYA